MDLKNLLHFINLRSDSHSQWEIQQYSNAIYELIQPIVPITCEAHNDYVSEGMNLSRMEKKLLADLLASNVTAKELLPVLIEEMGSEEAVMKHYEMGKREWGETKKKLNLD